MRPGDVVQHRRSGRRMLVESVDGKVAACAWFDACGELRRVSYLLEWLVPAGEALA